MNRDSFIGTEPFNFDEEKNPVSINEPAFSEWIDQLISYGELDEVFKEQNFENVIFLTIKLM